ncbi:MAG: hypothetical protein AAGP08_05270 [Pseudomonadota bacterium]
MADDQKRHAILAHLLDEGADHRNLGRGQASEHLIKQHDLWTRRHGTGHFKLAQVPHRQFLWQPFEIVFAEPDRQREFQLAVPVRAAGDHVPDVVGHEAHADIFGDADLGKWARHLIGATDTAANATGGRQRADLLVIQVNLARGLAMFPHDLAEDRRLARAVRTDEADAFARFDAEAYVIGERDRRSVSLDA